MEVHIAYPKQYAIKFCSSNKKLYKKWILFELYCVCQHTILIMEVCQSIRFLQCNVRSRRILQYLLSNKFLCIGSDEISEMGTRQWHIYLISSFYTDVYSEYKKIKLFEFQLSSKFKTTFSPSGSFCSHLQHFFL